MRKLLAVFLAATLLCVSSVPAFAEAASCTGPELAMMESAEHAHHHGVEVVDLSHDHTAGLFTDWQQDRIECGCGCHRSVESLPHLLAPHLIDGTNVHIAEESAPALVEFELALVCRLPRVSLPPPQLIS